MTIFYYPTLLGFVASTLAYVFNPSLATNGVYTGVVIVVVFWTGVFLSARGGTGGIAKLASSGLVVGTLIPGALLVVLGVVYLLQGNASAAPMNASHLLPEWTGIASLVLIVNNFLSYSGMEMNAVHVSSLQKPRSEFPKAMFFAVALVLVIFILPALAISWVIPAQELSLTAGVMQAFDAFFAYFGLAKLVPITVVGSGPNGANPHHELGERETQDGDMVVLDFGGLKDGYGSDTTRTVHVGEPTEEERRVFEVVRAAQQAGFEAVRPGVECQEIDRAARKVITDAGYGEYFIHRVGHGIGITTHEPPYMVEGETHPIKPGMCFSIEPGIYLPGRFGVRIEDIVVVTEDGGRRLNNTNHEMRIVA